MDPKASPSSASSKTKESWTHRWCSGAKSISSTVFHHITKHTGVGIVCAVAYFDPGNWGVDLQAGSLYGYKLLFVVLVAGLFAVFLQTLASRLGCVTGLDLASHCRLLLHDRPKHTKLYRWLALYPLYALSEIAIISTDLAELLGSAIALCMIFPKLPLWAGVLLTAVDVIFLLALRDPLGGRPVKMFEWLIAALVLAVLISLAIIIAKLNIDWADTFDGFVPSKTIFASGSLYTSVGIIGATVMPHSLFLGSALATQDRASTGTPKLIRAFASSEELSPQPSKATVPILQRCIRKAVDLVSSVLRKPFDETRNTRPKRHTDVQNNSLSFVKAHLYHGIVDLAVCLLGFAVLINSLILILASSVFFYGSAEGDLSAPASLFDAHDLIRDLVGKSAAFLFALALLAAGQSSSIIATVAGQAVSEGFLHWRVSPVVRRLLTRLIGLVPALVVAVAVGRSGINALLVVSQVALAIVLPFITLPLIWLTSSKSVMSVREPITSLSAGGNSTTPQPKAEMTPDALDPERGIRTADFSSGKVATTLGFIIWLIMVAANMYVIVALGLGQGT